MLGRCSLVTERPIRVGVTENRLVEGGGCSISSWNFTFAPCRYPETKKNPAYVISFAEPVRFAIFNPLIVIRVKIPYVFTSLDIVNSRQSSEDWLKRFFSRGGFCESRDPYFQDGRCGDWKLDRRVKATFGALSPPVYKQSQQPPVAAVSSLPTFQDILTGFCQPCDGSRQRKCRAEAAGDAGARQNLHTHRLAS